MSSKISYFRYNNFVDIEFRQILKEFLAENNLSQVEFARRVGVRQGQVSEWLGGRSKPAYEALKRIALAFGISADYLLGITETY